MMTLGAEVFDQLRSRLAARVGEAQLDALEAVLRELPAPAG
jgi:hypothetical protein